MKEIEINMVISNCENETEDSIMDKFIEWVEANGWSAGGGVRELTDEDKSPKIQQHKPFTDPDTGITMQYL